LQGLAWSGFRTTEYSSQVFKQAEAHYRSLAIDHLTLTILEYLIL
jgi:hypothetical protein